MTCHHHTLLVTAVVIGADAMTFLSYGDWVRVRVRVNPNPYGD